ncbi:MAG: triose-phosphate isomerase [Flavobacteriaceae bacterium]|jgi:triosephosphate isomerase|nr:triose-phosphate isomerase [Flavobacteriaceae bacterium]MDP4674799.1 triose-phosphate isomerase [Flavobacteriaceae bacterium]MDP4755172.1 triose-phosphate isomerase [Flavobacteriaceae bacterium]MDP4793906.1 triose-phosphate isomerase [Flavobacteriaceae bacterium]MDP4885926.1 triose-phosphate isomerase [Flavobacteriaceae bacterium]
MRKNIVAGNWKMNLNAEQTKALIAELTSVQLPENTRVLVAPPFVNLSAALEAAHHSSVEVMAQNMHQAESGAYTGEVAASMLTHLGVKTVVLGHSERRSYFGETDALLAQKVQTALNHQMEVVFCFGEELAQRESNTHFEVVASQLKNALFALPASAWSSIVLAYEPVWAIGTGLTASSAQAQEMHAFIRQTIAEAYSASLAQEVSILYGGSVKANNAAELFGQPDVDGGLIGGASLVAADFKGIIDGLR